MPDHKPAVSQFFKMAVTILSLVLVLAGAASAQRVEGIYEFPGYNFGAGGLVADSAGNLYGITIYGGTGNCKPIGCGTVFELSPTANGWSATTIYSFTDGTDGANPSTGLAIDGKGDLYGVSSNLTYSLPVIYRLSRTSGGVWSETTLYTFPTATGPGGPLVLDSEGNVYGSTFYGGSYSGTCAPYGCGTVFKLSPNAEGSWAETVLHTFSGGSDGANPVSPLTLVGRTLYGATAPLGNNFSSCSGIECGLVFELTPTSAGWKETVLHLFTGGRDGASPLGGLVADSAGNLFGIASGATAGAPYPGAFELSRITGGWKETTLHRFAKDAVGYPIGPLALDAKGNLLGESGSAYCNSFISPCGVVYELSDSSSGWTVSAQYRLGEAAPTGDLLLDAAGHVFGVDNGPSETGVSGAFEVIR